MVTLLILLGLGSPLQAQKPVQEIKPEKLAGFLEKHPDTQVVDVREEWERKKVKLPDSIHLPLGQISQALDLLKTDKPVVTYCKTGRRSRNAAEILQKMGFKEVYTIEGGILAYRKSVDPSLPSY